MKAHRPHLVDSDVLKICMSPCEFVHREHKGFVLKPGSVAT